MTARGLVGRETRRPALFALHVLLPILGGASVYLLFRSRHLVVFEWAGAWGLDPFLAPARAFALPLRPGLPDWFLFSVPDGLWVYSLSACMSLIWQRRGPASRDAWLASGLALAVFFEFAQLGGRLPGTFDPLDLALCVAAFALARGVVGRLEER